jgi:hypothetical protein
MTLFPSRFKLLKAFVVLFLLMSFLVRLSFLFWNFPEMDKGIFNLLVTFLVGFLFDVAVVSFFVIPYILYLLLIPKKLHGSWLDKTITYFGFAMALLIMYFSFFGEFTFWDEFERRYNFIAVDYLIYTYEVVKNINESYPLPILVSAMVILVIASVLVVYRKRFFKETFASDTNFKTKAIAATPYVFIVIICSLFITNK